MCMQGMFFASQGIVIGAYCMVSGRKFLNIKGKLHQHPEFEFKVKIIQMFRVQNAKQLNTIMPDCIPYFFLHFREASFVFLLDKQ